jgi:hypothetical protein
MFSRIVVLPLVEQLALLVFAQYNSHIFSSPMKETYGGSVPISGKAFEGGYRDASVEEQTEAVFQVTNTPAYGTGDPDAPCAFRTLLQHMLAQQELDRTQVCRQCKSVVRVHAVKI